MRIVCLSDTHDAFRGLQVPDGDLLLHAGDLSRKGLAQEVLATAEWLRSLPHRHKLVIAGNHDFCLEQQDPRGLLRGLTYLQDESCEVEGLQVFGSPWSPAHGVWAFQAERGEPLEQKWQRIPEETQILITHGPPRGILDRHVSGIPLGCQQLRERVESLKPRLHLFGHVHESHGTHRQDETLYVNACNCSFGYKKQQPAIVVDWHNGELLVQPQPPETEPTVQPLKAWDDLVKMHGPPREVRYMPAPEQRVELDQQHVFWLEVASGRVRFRPAGAHDDVTDRGPDHTLRQWAFTFGVPVRSDWLDPLHSNPWRAYGEVPKLPD